MRGGGTLTPGEAACFASHARLWTQCETEREPIVVMEDDVELDDRFPEALYKADVAISHGTLFVRLCGLRPKRYVTLDDVGDGYRIVRYLKGPSGAQAYSLSPEGARRFGVAAREWAEPVDDFIADSGFTVYPAWQSCRTAQHARRSSQRSVSDRRCRPPTDGKGDSVAQ